jgi:ferrochelatase
VHPADFSHGQPPRLGVLIANLGSPDEPTPRALRRYLAQFLWDRRIVDVPRPLWWLILHGIILRTRPRRSAALYRKVWRPDGAPLKVIAGRQRDLLQAELEKMLPGEVTVALGMRYGGPSIAEALEQLRRANAQRVLVLPLFPQYSASTTASAFDAVADTLKGWRWLPELRFVNQYHDHPGYIEALATSIRDEWQGRERPKKLLFSFHGTPERFLHEGDPYFCQCQKSARLVAERLGLEEGEWEVVFQSRFGREQWLKPYADERLKTLAEEGVGSVDLICPGFSADCLETLEEMAGENRELFLAAGGRDYHYIPALNDRIDHIRSLTEVIAASVQGWPEAEGAADPERDRRRAARAAALKPGE